MTTLGQHRLGRRRRSCPVRRPRRLPHDRPARHERDRRAAFIFSDDTNNIGFLDVPASLQHGTGFTSIPTNTKVTRDQADARCTSRPTAPCTRAPAASTRSSSACRPTSTGNDVLSGESRNRVTIRWNSALSTGVPVTRGTYGYYEVRSNARRPEAGPHHRRQHHSTMLGLFIQDAWTINNKLTVNLGVRTERERVPTYTTGDDIPDSASSSASPTSWRRAPASPTTSRATATGRCPVRGACSTTLQARTAARLVRRRQVAASTTTRSTPSTSRRWWTAPTARRPARHAYPPDRSTSVTRRSAPTAIEPDLKPMRLQEATLSLDHQLNDVMAVGVRYVHKQVDRAIEDTGFLLPDGSEGYVIANPGEGITSLAFTNPNVALPKADARLRRGRVRVRQAPANNWYSARQLHVEPPLWQLLGPVAVGRKRPHQPERRPPVRLPGDDVPGRRHAGAGPAGDGSSAPVQGAVHLPVRLRHQPRR